MQEISEKIKDRFMKVGNIQFSNYTKPLITVEDAIKIVNQVAEETSTGEISDGYHTFNELYHHRAVLFSVICNTYKELAWKSKLHDTGDMYDGMFIVGIETPEGQATYHYDVDPYWDMFDVKELPKAHKWDGHTPDEAIRRIGLLGIDTNVGNKKPEYVRYSTYEQVAWERDVAIEQLHELGYEFGEKIEKEEEFCEWGYDEFEEAWRTECDTLFKLNESDRECTYYCSCCGKKIKVVK